MWAGYRSARVGCALGVRGTVHSARRRQTRPLGSKQTTRSLWTSCHGMQTLVALLVAAVAACAVARPPGPSAAPRSLQAQLGPHREPAPPPPARLADFMPRFRLLLPHYLGYEESPRLPPPIPQNDWLNKEIDRLNEMDEDEEVINPYEMELARMITQDMYAQGLLDSPINIQEPMYAEAIGPIDDYKAMAELTDPNALQSNRHKEMKHPLLLLTSSLKETVTEHRKKFAFTPMDKEFFEPDTQTVSQDTMMNQGGPVIMHHEGGAAKMAVEVEPPRQTRQNPNLSKQKHLLEPDIGKLKTGLANKDFHIPVSLLPTNLRWLKVSQPTDYVDHDERSHEEGMMPKQHVLESTSDPADSIYGVALVAAVGTALTMAIFGFAFGWYTLSKKAKAAADVDYPAYGVTGPTMDTSGDRKLAHSAHMYHYQHQKQQIIAMERNGLEQRTGSVSDPESEEENEEGDYTVYECPGFATTGEMEVKNPLFSEDPTPATPGKCDEAKPQPKD